jgi:hypothetical protein
MTNEELEQLRKEINEGEAKLTAELRSRGFPEGFEPVFLYHDGRTPYVRDGVVRVRVPDQNSLEFAADWTKAETLPSLPLKGHGGISHQGWDIPTRWAIDSANKCWADNAHGHSLHRVEEKELLGMARSEDAYALNSMHRILGKKPPLPEWARTALSAGWTPAPGFSLDDYEA